MFHIIRFDRKDARWSYVEQGDSKRCSRYNANVTQGSRYAFALVTSEELPAFIA